jgi:hypothetical protein
MSYVQSFQLPFDPLGANLDSSGFRANVYHPGEHDRIAAQQGVVSPDIVDSELLERCEEKGGVREIEKPERDRALSAAENAVG